MSDDNPYRYPGSSVLRNKFGITNDNELDLVERRLVAQRSSEGIPAGNFDLDHLRAIHKHLFQDVYEWAGEVRTVEISKGGDRFEFAEYIGREMGSVHRRLENVDFLRHLSHAEFASAAAIIMADVNAIHPFREGNGRTQLAFLEQLAERAGHKFDATLLDGHHWIEASRAAHQGDYEPMRMDIDRALLGRSYGHDPGQRLQDSSSQPTSQPGWLESLRSKMTPEQSAAFSAAVADGDRRDAERLRLAALQSHRSGPQI